MGPTPEPARASEAHPGLLQILDLLSNQPVTEAALQTFCLNHVAFRPICGPSVTTTKTQRGRVAPSKIRDSIAACLSAKGSLIPIDQVGAVVQFSLQKITRIGHDHRIILRQKVAKCGG